MAVLPLGMRFEHPSASSAKPHILSYATARSLADDGLLEVWNGTTSAARVLRLNKDGQLQLQDGAVGAPALAPEGDKDTGVYFVSGTPEVAVAIAGSKVLSVVAAGLLPGSNDGAALGGAASAFSDLFLASGAVINFANGDITLTHASGVLTVAGGLFALSKETGITASTTQTQGQQPLTQSVNVVATVANPNDTVTMPPAAPGKIVGIINEGANTLQVFPASGDEVAIGTGVDTPVTMAAGQAQIYLCMTDTIWARLA